MGDGVDKVDGDAELNWCYVNQIKGIMWCASDLIRRHMVKIWEM